MNFIQVMRVMKISMFLMTFCLLQLSAATFGQRLTIRKTNSTIPEILLEIRSQTGYDFFYKTGLFDNSPKVNMVIINASLEEVLKRCLESNGFNYGIKDKIVTIKSYKENSSVNGLNHVSQQIQKGRVVKASDESGIPGVTVHVIGTKLSTSTNQNGSFSINIPASAEKLSFSILGYKKQIVSIQPGQEIKIRLEFAVEQIDAVEVTIQARRKLDTEVAVLEERRKSGIVQDAISAQQIERTASITTSQALQRVSGVTVTDDKYIAVRGLGDRSVIGQLNGVRLASSDPDRSSVPLDLVPASLLDNVTVYKTVTPDLPADAAGGIVELKTKSIPDKQTLTIGIQQGNNTNIGIGGQVNSFFNSDMGFFSQKINQKYLSKEFLDLNKQYPGGLTQIQQFIAGANNEAERVDEVNRINQIMKKFDPILTTSYKKAQLDGIYSISYGNSFKLFDHHKIGVIASASYYGRSTDIVDGELNQYSIYQGIITGSPFIHQSRTIPSHITPNMPKFGKYVGYSENTGTQVLNYGLLTGISYRFSAQHEIGLQYLYSKGAETQATNLNGQYQYVVGFSGPIYNRTYSLKQTKRKFNTFNLQGEHKFGKSEYSPTFSYNMASSIANHNNPDYRFVNIAEFRPEGGGFYPGPIVNGLPSYFGTDAHYALISGYVRGYGPYGLIQADPNGRRYRNLTENNYNYKANLTLPFKLLDNLQKLKVGVNYLYRDRTFEEFVLNLPGSNFASNKQYPLYKVNGNLNQLVGLDQVGVHIASPTSGEGAPLVNGFLYNSLKSPNNYKGFYETNAFFGMLDLKPSSTIRLTGGVRFEKTDIQSKVDTAGVYIDPSIAASGVNAVYVNPVSKYKESYRPFYSVNLIYTFKDNMNFRAAYNTSLARPEIREMTNVFEFDPFVQALVVGNPNLKNQRARALDFRWEWFPNKGEVIAVSLFEKQIYNQLEKVFILNSQGTNSQFPEFPTIAFQNNPSKGQVWGIELEVVKNLGDFYGPLQDVMFGANVTLVQSDVEKTKERIDAARVIDRQSPRNSPLFEQAPYSINAYLNYTLAKTGTDATLTFNMVGERLIQVNMDGTPDLYSNPVSMLDFVVSQKITPRLKFKGYFKNILNPAFEETYNNAGTGSTFYGKKYVRRSYTKGSDWMIGLSYDLFKN